MWLVAVLEKVILKMPLDAPMIKVLCGLIGFEGIFLIEIFSPFDVKRGVNL